MKPRLLTILLLLLAGAVVNVGVAWALMRWEPGLQITTGVPHARAEQFWPDSSLRPSVNDPIASASRTHGVGRMKFRGTALRRVQPGSATLRWEGLIVDRAGLPLHALEVRRTRSTSRRHHGVVGRGTRTDDLAGNLVLPIWRGIAVNTLAYAGALWLLFVAPFTLRRLIRARRGLCPACGYPVGESAVCSECGKAVRSRRPGQA